MKIDFDYHMSYWVFTFRAQWQAMGEKADHPAQKFYALLHNVANRPDRPYSDIWGHLDALHAVAQQFYDEQGDKPSAKKQPEAFKAWMVATEPARAVWRGIRNERYRILDRLCESAKTHGAAKFVDADF